MIKYEFRKGLIKRLAGSSTKERVLPSGSIGEGKGQFRSNAKIRRLNMYNVKVKRDKDGNIKRGSVLPQNEKIPKGMPARIEPSRNWFQNTRVIGQAELTRFREALKDKVNDPYSVLLKSSKIPFALLETDDETKLKHIKVKKHIDFKKVFGDKSTRKKANIEASSIEDLVNSSQKQVGEYSIEKDNSDEINKTEKKLWGSDGHRHSVFTKGTSKRIWNELYKVIDSSDVIIEVLDARDPMGSRCKVVEKYLKHEKPYKHIIFVLNKCDLVPTWVTVRWVKILSQEYPTLAFHASITNPFGKGSLIQLLRQFSALHKDKKSISIGFVGYPNVGKSSIINTLKKKRVCSVAPTPGETKIWQYVSLMSRIHLVDCPGVTYPEHDTDIDLVLKGVVRAEKLPQPSYFAKEILERVKKEYLIAHYGIADWTNYEDFLKQLANKTGKLHPGGEPDIETTSVRMIYDWQRGKIPWFVAPSMDDDIKKEEDQDSVKAEEFTDNEETDLKEESEENQKTNTTPFAIDKQDLSKIKINPDIGLDSKDRMGVGYLPENEIESNRISSKSNQKKLKKTSQESQQSKVIDFDALYDDIILEDSNDEEESLEENDEIELEEEEIVPKPKKDKSKKRKVSEIIASENIYIPSSVLKRRKRST